MSKRELDLGRLMQKVGRRIEAEGETASQLFYDWQRDPTRERQEDTTRGGGNGGASSDDRLREQAERRQAANLRHQWLQVRLQLEALSNRADWLLDQAKGQPKPLDSHRTPAQVEAEGWCGNHWAKIGELVPIGTRPTGEPFYRGRCRRCGSWPEGDPPVEVLKVWRDGKTLRRAAS